MEAYIRAVLRHATYDIDSDGSAYGAIDIAPELAVSAVGSTRARCALALEQAVYQRVCAALAACQTLPPIDGVAPPDSQSIAPACAAPSLAEGTA